MGNFESKLPDADRSPVVAILIKTFMREESLKNLLFSIQKHRPRVGVRIYIADDGPVESSKKRIYKSLEQGGNYVKVFSEQVGVGRARNYLLEKTSEKYILRLDDDYQFCSQTSLGKMIKVLEGVDEIGCISSIEKQVGLGKGVLSGGISPYQGYFSVDEDTVLKRVKKPDEFEHSVVDGVRYSTCDFTRNFLLCKRKIFDSVKWEENLTFAGEHIDFLLQLHESEWNVAFTPDSVHIHNENIVNPEYNEYVLQKWKSGDGKRESDQKREILMRKWGVNSISVKYGPVLYLKVLAAKLLSLILSR